MRLPRLLTESLTSFFRSKSFNNTAFKFLFSSTHLGGSDRVSLGNADHEIFQKIELEGGAFFHKRRVSMKIHKIDSLLACLMVSPFLLGSGSAAMTVIIDDSFDDGNIATNTNGTGSGFNSGVFSSGATPTEALGAVGIAQGAGGGASRSQIASTDLFNVNDSLAVTTTFTVEDFGRNSSVNGNSTRHFVGLVSSPQPGGNGIQNGGPFETRIDGLWIGLQPREAVGGLAADFDLNGQGILAYVDGNTITTLATWEWSQDLVTWDAASGFRSDRIAVDLMSSLELSLSSDDTGYSLSFSSGSGTTPGDISGTWVDAGVTNDLDSVRAAVYSQGDSGDLNLSSILVTQGEAIPEPGSVMLCGLAGLLAFRRKRA